MPCMTQRPLTFLSPQKIRGFQRLQKRMTLQTLFSFRVRKLEFIPGSIRPQILSTLLIASSFLVTLGRALVISDLLWVCPCGRAEWHVNLAMKPENTARSVKLGENPLGPCTTRKGCAHPPKNKCHYYCFMP